MPLRLPTLTPQPCLELKQLMQSLVSRLGFGTPKSRLGFDTTTSRVVSVSLPQISSCLSLKAPCLDSISVNHSILLYKLEHCGIRGIVNIFFGSFLKQKSVCCN